MGKGSQDPASQCAVVEERMEQFEYLYDAFFQYHVVPVIRLPHKMNRAKESRAYQQCYEVVVNEEEAHIESFLAHDFTTAGLSPTFLRWVIHSNHLLSSHIKKHVFSSKGGKVEEKIECRKQITELSKLLEGSVSKFDDHTLVIWTWWLPQVIEVFSLARLALSSDTYREKLLPTLQKIFSYFQQNTVMALYLFTGRYMDRGQFNSLLAASKETARSQLLLKQGVEELSESIRMNTVAMREFIAHASSFSSSSGNSATLPPLLTFAERQQEELLLEPNFRILMALCHLVMVQNYEEGHSRTIVRYCGAKKCLVSLVKMAMNRDIENAGQSEVLFREDTPAIKLMALLFGQWGTEYLEQMLQPTFQSISKSSLLNVEEGTSERSPEYLAQIEKICDEFLQRLYRSTHIIPIPIRVLLSHVQKETSQKFPEARQRVIGSFMFLRFLMPAFQFPERILKMELSESTKKAGRFVSRVLLPIASGGAVPDKTPSLQKYCDSKQKELFAHFDELADISHLSISSSDLELPLDVNTTYSDLKEITVLLMDSVPSMQKIIERQFDTQTMGCYLQFLNIQNPPVFPQTQNKEEVYYKAAGNLTDLLPSEATIYLLGVSHSQPRDRKSFFTWFNRYTQIQETSKSLAKTAVSNQDEMQAMLNIFVELHEFCNLTFTRWSQVPDLEPRKRIAQRKAYHLSYIIQRIQEAPVPFFIPEVWEIWTNCLDTGKKLADLFMLDALSQFESTDLVYDALTRILVFLRWVISRLVNLESRNLHGV